MDEAAMEPEPPGRFDQCTRCLQPVPVRASRCPGCGHPHQNRRWIPLAIGAAGLFALVFVMLLMYYTAWKSDLANRAPLEDESAQPDIMVKTPPEGSQSSSPPPAPEKKPPLNDK